MDSLKEVARMEKNFASIGDQVKLLKYNYQGRIQKLKEAIEKNFSFVLQIVEEHKPLFCKKKNI